jgi:hypothetical protein
MTKEDVINRVLEEWLDEFVGDLQARARERVPQASGEGAASFNSSMVRASLNQAAVASVAFREYMRLFDMRKVERSKNLGPEGIERIKRWIQKKGISNFMSGYKYPTTYKFKPGTVPEKTILNNIAWGISRKKKRIKRRQWYNKMKGSQVYSLYFKILDEVMPILLEEAKRSVENPSGRR